jgi:tRNA (mo5U34)-methyltransferase
MTTRTKTPDAAQLDELVRAVPFWFHSIDLAPGVVTPGSTSQAALAELLRLIDLPDLTGKTVLDVGAWDGFFSFEAERRGASRVVALDHFVWSLDIQPNGVPSASIPGAWQPDALPGKKGFDTARRALGSDVEDVTIDFMTADLDALGSFDVVLYLGVLYHMRDPLAALTRLSKVTREVAVIETQAVVVPGYEEYSLFEFYPFDELNSDETNWWAPNAKALEDLCKAAGFARVEWKQRAARRFRRIHVRGRRVEGYRAILHAYKDVTTPAEARR